ncbi:MULTISPECIES: hypothetical protein [unclassified Rhodococcus (in: high G+C Gram-positive bacteria)]|uniref:hypothetical protein n=1 Tax=unclassified Rhodococcus (in: high G+C Gram-positive bacteria) TaxID=192944 RepID=UPI00163A07D6|nr:MULTISPECIES: hypothetical protein [unclassified Rhodococcus (in: high G+C Gram-positive bacteria)]MBC2644156.1 hypothetical protein [Rhodococcus sp. 3A]MBC2891105.1 hypothetical protein [Rhodococcus sp. 4CII]
MARMRRVVGGLIAAGPLVLLLAAPAAADPADVALTAAAAGSTVTATITNATSEDIVCGLGGLHAADDIVDPESVAVFHASNVVIAPGPREFVFEAVPDGDYLIHWICGENAGPGDEVWGSSPLPETAYAKTATAQPLPVSVRTETCFGSVCLPPGLGVGLGL